MATVSWQTTYTIECDDEAEFDTLVAKTTDVASVIVDELARKVTFTQQGEPETRTGWI